MGNCGYRHYHCRTGKRKGHAGVLWEDGGLDAGEEGLTFRHASVHNYMIGSMQRGELIIRKPLTF